MPSLTGFQEDRVGAFIEKDPYSILDYSLDWKDWMPSGDHISSITVTADTGITVDSSTNTNFVATANISGGTAGTIYNIEFKIITTNGLRDSRNFRIKVVERQA